MAAASPQVAAHVNGIPLAGSAFMNSSVFASIAGQSPYAMESFFVGPPYIILSAGDMITCGLVGGSPNDTFTVGAYIEERPFTADLDMGG